MYCDFVVEKRSQRVSGRVALPYGRVIDRRSVVEGAVPQCLFPLASRSCVQSRRNDSVDTYRWRGCCH